METQRQLNIEKFRMPTDNGTIDFARLCLETRKRLGLTQKDMAARLNAKVRSYQNWEAGEVEPSAQAAYRLAQMQCEFQLEELKQKISEELKRKISEIGGDESKSIH